MTDRAWMQRAIGLARGVQGTTAPNPSVGAVIVSPAGALLGQGATQPAGQNHAEVAALADCVRRGNDPAGATVYVTLEPCCHHGKTPPCTTALLDAGVQRVVVGTVDPFPKVRGRGIATLRERGLHVEVGVEAEACEALILGFARAITKGLPEVSCKAGVSLDGRIATAAGESQWITGPRSRSQGHQLRASHDAILVGIGTVVTDNPRLTCRVAEGRDPRPVILDSQLRISADAAVLHGPRRALVLTTVTPTGTLNADVVQVASDTEGRVDIEAALRELVAHDLHRVLVEGGGQVHRSLFDAGLVDTLHLFVAGSLVPGGLPWIGGSPIDRLSDAPKLALASSERLGDDLWLQYRARHDVPPDLPGGH